MATHHYHPFYLSTCKTDPLAGGRPVQLDQVLREFSRASPAVLLGDLNTRPDDPSIQERLARDGAMDALANEDSQCVDWILVRGAKIGTAGKYCSGASDHPLYWCDMELDKKKMHNRLARTGHRGGDVKHPG